MPETPGSSSRHVNGSGAAFGATAGEGSTPKNVNGSGGKLRERLMLNYVTCHLCETPYAEGKVFWVMSCKHVLCNDEKHRHQGGICTFCRTKGVEAHQLGPNMPKELQNYFTAPDIWARQIEEATPVLLYMNETLQRYISQQAGELRSKENIILGVREKLRVFEKTEKKIEELEKQNQILEQENAELKRRLTFPEARPRPQLAQYSHPVQPPSRPRSHITQRLDSGDEQDYAPPQRDMVFGSGSSGYVGNGMVERGDTASGDEEDSQNRKRSRYETPRPKMHIPPSNLNIPPTIEESPRTTPLANLHPNTAYLEPQYPVQDARVDEYEEAPVMPYRQNPMSAQKSRINVDDYAFQGNGTPVNRPAPRSRPASAVPDSRPLSGVFSQHALRERLGMTTPVPRSASTVSGTRPFRPMIQSQAVGQAGPSTSMDPPLHPEAPTSFRLQGQNAPPRPRI